MYCLNSVASPVNCRLLSCQEGHWIRHQPRFRPDAPQQPQQLVKAGSLTRARQLGLTQTCMYDMPDNTIVGVVAGEFTHRQPAAGT